MITFQLYRRRPILVEAIQLNATDWDLTEQVAEWCSGALLDLDHFLAHNDRALMYVPDGDQGAEGQYAEDTDWIVRLGDNRFVVVPDKIFRAQYEPLGVFT